MVMASQISDPNWNLKNICHELRTVSHKWFKIGVQLGIPRHNLEKFEKEESDPLSAVVDYVLKGNETNPPGPVSWESIVAASQSIGETGLAEYIDKKHCNECDSKVKQGAGKPSAEKPQLPPSESDANMLDPVVIKDLEFILEENLTKIIVQYASYVDDLRAAIEEKKVAPKELCGYLVNLPVSSKGDLTLLSHKKSELQKLETIAELFNFLSTECASFLNYEIFQHISKKYGIHNEHYLGQLKNYAEKHKVSEVAKMIPNFPEPQIGTTELVLKYDVEETCKLARVKDLQKTIAKVLGILPSALQILSIENGCVVVTFLIASSIADALFTPDTVFTPQQEQELRAASVLWMKCNHCTFHLVQTSPQGTTSVPFRSVLRQSLSPIPFESETNENIRRLPPPKSLPARDKPKNRAVNLEGSDSNRRPHFCVTRPRSRTVADTLFFLSSYDQDGDVYEKTGLPLPLPQSPRHHREKKNLPEADETFEKIATIKVSMKYLQLLVNVIQDNIQKEIRAQQGEILTLTDTVKKLSNDSQQLEAQVKALSSRSGLMPPSSNSPNSLGYMEVAKTTDTEQQMENVQELRSFGVKEVLCLLETMKLSQYSEVFNEKSIDGKILAECDESVLVNDLRITSKLHRIRLLKVISGRHSTQALRHGWDPRGART